MKRNRCLIFLLILPVLIIQVCLPIRCFKDNSESSHIPQAFCSERKEDPFGVFNDIATVKGKMSLDYAVELGIKRTRLGLFWEMVEPFEGKYNWTLVDKVINMHHKAGISPLITVKSVSRWGAYSGGGPLGKYRAGPPKDMKKYRKFIRAVASRYKDKVKYWQIENEVFDKTLYTSPFWNGTKEQYLELLKAAYEEIKKVDPDAKVVIAGFANFLFVKYSEGNPNAKLFFEYVLDKGRDYYDVIDFHQYFTTNHLSEELAIINGTMKKLGLKKELITTEVGDFDIRLFLVQALNPQKKIPIVQEFMKIPSVRNKLNEYLKGGVTSRERNQFSIFLKENSDSGPLLEKYQAENLTKRVCINLSQGVTQFYWAWMMDQKDPIDWYMGHMSLTDRDGRRKPHFYTYKILISKLRGFKNVKEIKVAKGIRFFQFSFPDKRKLFIVWSEPKKQEIDLRPYISNPEIKITHIITKRRKTDGNAMVHKTKCCTLALTVTPIIVEGR